MTNKIYILELYQVEQWFIHQVRKIVKLSEGTYCECLHRTMFIPVYKQKIRGFREKFPYCKHLLRLLVLLVYHKFLFPFTSVCKKKFYLEKKINKPLFTGEDLSNHILSWEHHSPHSSTEPSVQLMLILQMAFPSFPKTTNRTHPQI